jgi:hypothetical protein
MMNRYSIEEYRARLDEIIRRYRLGATGRDAVARLKELGFTAGEALRLLRPR